MLNQQTNRKKKNKDNSQTGILAQWGVPLAILLVVITVLVINFMIVSTNAAKENADEQLLGNTRVIAEECSGKLKTMTTVGNVLAAWIDTEKISDTDYLRKVVDSLIFNVDSLAKVAIVDSDGSGVCSGIADVVDLSKETYFDGTLMQEYLLVDENSILGEKGFVSCVPVKDGGRYIGTIYLFMTMKDMMNADPIDSTFAKSSYALMDSTGVIYENWGNDSKLLSEGDLFTALGSASVYDITMSKLKMRLSKDNQIAFQCDYVGGNETVLICPVGLNDWKYVATVSQRYVDQIINQESKAAHDMVRNLAIAISSVMIIIILISAFNKYRFNETNKDLSNKADTDLLTGVNNKIATERKIKEFIEENPDTQSIMLLFDVDNFKKINDTMGHAFGDEVLKTIGHGLSNEFRATDIIGRIGGDEFVLFLKNLKTDELVQKEGSRVADFFKNFKAGDYVKYSATASIGACVFPRDGESFEELYRACDNALYEAKRQGKNRLVYYTKKMSGNTELRDQEAKNNPGARN